jgi:hypothetical protein
MNGSIAGPPVRWFDMGTPHFSGATRLRADPPARVLANDVIAR